MTANGWLQIGVFLLSILAVTPLMGRFMTRVFQGERTWLDPLLRPIERLIYHADSNRVHGFLLAKGHFSTNKIVAAGQVASTDAEGFQIGACEAFFIGADGMRQRPVNIKKDKVHGSIKDFHSD